MKYLNYAFVLGIVAIAILGCKTTHDTIAPATRPAGTVVAAPQAVTQGVAEGYADQAGSTVENPYGR